MSKPFDATLKTLVEKYPLAWLAQAGIPIMGSVEVIETDLSTVTAAADKVLLIRHPKPLLIHIELQSGYDANLYRRLLLYNVLLYYRYGIPVHTILVLLRPEAQTSNLTGRVEYASPFGTSALAFSYQLISIWEQPADTFLNGGLGVLPLASVSSVSQEELPDILRQISNRLDREAEPAEAEILWTATYILAGLRYSPALVTELFEGVRNMKESSTYQAILDEGRVEGRMEGRAEGRAEEIKRMLLLLGEKRFGKPTLRMRKKIETMTSVDTLEQLSLRLLDATNWKDLLAS